MPHKKPEILYSRLRSSLNDRENTITIYVEGRKNPSETFKLTQTLTDLSKQDKKHLIETYKGIFFRAYNAEPWEEIHRQFVVKSTELRSHIHIILQNKQDLQPDEYAINQIGKHHINFLMELEKNPNANLGRVAWISRNIFELFLWLSYITSSPENAKAFVGYVILDQQEILEGFANYGEEPTKAPGYQKQYESQLKRYKEFAQNYGTTIPRGQLKTKTLADMAHERFSNKEHTENVKADWIGFYRLSSKFVHPSPHFISGDIPEKSIVSDKHVMLFRVLAYSKQMLELYREGIASKKPEETDTVNVRFLEELEEKAWYELSQGRLGEFAKCAHQWHKTSQTTLTSPDGPFYHLMTIAVLKSQGKYAK